MKQFFPGDDEEEVSDVKPAPNSEAKNGPAGWTRIDGGSGKSERGSRSRSPVTARGDRRALDSHVASEASRAPNESAALPQPVVEMDVDAPVPVLPSVPSVTAVPAPKSNLHTPTSTAPTGPPLSTRSSNREPATSTKPTVEVGSAARKSKALDSGTPATRDGDIYTIVSQVGEGTFGQVYKAVNSHNNSKVALKRIRMEGEKDGFPVTAMREIKLLQSLRHENVVKLHEMMVSKSAS